MRARIHLTPRQREVLRLLAVGATHKDIATQLGVTHKTARNHLSNLYEQLDVHTRAEAVLCAMRLGLVDMAAFIDEANALSTQSPAVNTIGSAQQPGLPPAPGGANGRSS